MIKICPFCEKENKENAIICLNCMEDISNVAPVSKEKKKAKIILNENGYDFEKECVIGRAGFMADVLKEFLTVSRRHTRIYYENNSWYIEDLKSTNGTFVNESKITSKTKLKNNDIISLGSKVKLIFRN